MIHTLILDFSEVLLFARDRGYHGKLNDLHKQLSAAGKYNIFEQFELHRDLLDMLKEIKDRHHLTLHLFTHGSMHTIPEIRAELTPVFDSLHGVDEVGFRKNDARAYKTLTEILKLQPQDTLFIDDTLENIEAAQEAGLQAVQYVSLEQLRDKLSLLGLH